MGHLLCHYVTIYPSLYVSFSNRSSVCPSVFCALHLRNRTTCDFFHFFKILIFRVVNGVKGQNIAQNNKTFCLLCSISKEPCIIWFSFIIHTCKMIKYPSNISRSAGLLGRSKGKKRQKNSARCTLYLRNHHMILIYGTHVKKDNIFFSNFQFSGLLVW